MVFTFWAIVKNIEDKGNKESYYEYKKSSDYRSSNGYDS